MPASYTRLAPATVTLLTQKASEGYYITPRSAKGFSDFVNALSQVPFNNDPEAITITHPIGRPVLTALTDESIEAFHQLAIEYILVDPFMPPSPSLDSVSLVLNNIPTHYLTPVTWPTAFPQDIMQHLPTLPPPKVAVYNSTYQRYFMSTQAANRLATMAGLSSPVPRYLSVFINDILANPQRQFIDNRPSDLITVSEQNLLLGLPSVWFEPLPIDYRMHLQLTPGTISTLLAHASSLNIQSRSNKNTDTATISAFLEAIGQDCLRWN